MRIIERYLLREVLLSWVGVTLVLLVILLSNQLATVLSRAAEGGFSGNVVLVLLWLAAIQQLVGLIPLGLFLAVMLSLGRLYHESELTAMRACGLGNRQLLRPVLVLAILAAGLMGWLALLVAPSASQRAVDLRSQAVREARFASLQPGKFRSFGGNSNIVFYAESADAQGVLHNVYAERTLGEQLEIWTAQRAVQQGIGEQQQTFVLYDGQRYEGAPGGSEFRIMEFKEAGIPVSLPDVSANADRMDMRTTASLWNSTAAEDHAELHLRRAQPLFALILALLAVPLAKLRPRQGRYARLASFILVYLLYRGLITFGDNLLLTGKVSPALGLWWVHAVALLTAWWLWRETPMQWWRLRSATKVSA
jgi:lipopolysaccharide export system permease protein